MTAPTNWPDPKRPGVPMFPEREGWHVMKGRVAGQTALTHWNGREWGGGEQMRALNTSPEWYRYIGAVLTPTQINEMLAAERKRIGRAAFGNGYLIACCNIHNMHNEPSIAADILSQADITISEVRAMDLSEYDASALEEIRAARSNDPILKEPTSAT